jgi:hypothetical protein
MKDCLHLLLNLLIVVLYMMISRDYLILFFASSTEFESKMEYMSSCIIAATIMIYVSYPFNGTKNHRTEFSLVILGVAVIARLMDMLIV